MGAADERVHGLNVQLSRWCGLLLASCCWALAFPTPGWSGLAWFAPGLIWVSTLGLSNGETFRFTYLGGWLSALISLRWLLHIPHTAGAIAGWLSLSAYCALYPALWAVSMVWLSNSNVGARTSWRMQILTLSRFSTRRRLALPMIGAASWVSLEWIQAHLFTGFPWNLLGVTQYRVLPLIQISAWTGVYGVSFLVVWFSMGLALACTRISHAMESPQFPLMATVPPRSQNSCSQESSDLLSRGQRWAWTTDLRLPLFAAVMVSLFGIRTAISPLEGTSILRFALVQPSIPQRLLWNPDEGTSRFEQIYKLSQTALSLRPDVLVWPEGSMPEINKEQFSRMTNLVRESGAYWVFGADDVENRDGQVRAYNSAFLFDPTGSYLATYRKQHLVMFGEYVPLEKWFPILRNLTPIGSSFSTGLGPVDFRLGTNNAVGSPLICFEDVFPHHVRDYVKPETDFLLELTNDGWFGESSAQWQHAANVTFRAVENGIRIVRCANNGISCWIDERGRWHDVHRSSQGSVYASGYSISEVPIGRVKAETYYHQFGDRFVGLSVLVVGVAAIRLRPTRKQV